jgi:hypothetical protein
MLATTFYGLLPLDDLRWISWWRTVEKLFDPAEERGRLFREREMRGSLYDEQLRVRMLRRKQGWLIPAPIGVERPFDD